MTHTDTFVIRSEFLFAAFFFQPTDVAGMLEGEDQCSIDLNVVAIVVNARRDSRTKLYSQTN